MLDLGEAGSVNNTFSLFFGLIGQISNSARNLLCVVQSMLG